jgi:hypothetical protein
VAYTATYFFYVPRNGTPRGQECDAHPAP